MLEALNEAKLDWVNTDGKDNRYCLGSSFSGKDGRSVDRRDQMTLLPVRFVPKAEAADLHYSGEVCAGRAM